MSTYIPPAAVRTARHATIGSLFESRVPAQPAAPAVTDGARSLSYAALNRRANQLVHLFAAAGIQRGERVALLARNCLEYVEIELAAAKTGIILAALNWRLGNRELQHCIQLVAPRLIIAQSELVGALQALDIGDVAQLVIGEDYEGRLAKCPTGNPRHPVDPEDGLVILYTSGTTGLPKGALISHRAMIARAMCFAGEFQVPIGDHFIAWAPFYHMASTDQALATLLRGGVVHVVDGYQPEQLLDLLEQVPTRFLILMPGMVDNFVEAVTARRPVIKGIGICGAMPDLVPRQDIANITRLLNAPYMNSFGATETGMPPATGATLAIGVAPTNLAKRQSAFCDLRLVDPDDNDVPDGTPGEVALRGPTLFSGYWNADAVNEHDFRGGWFHMGDVLRRTPDGRLDYVDRVKYMIKSGGENIYPAEIEQVLLADPAITEAIVVRKADRKWGEVPVAFVVRSDVELTAAMIAARCDRDLSRYKRPKGIYFIDSADLPRSTTGKVQRHALEQQLEAAEAPSDSLQQ